MTNYCSSVKHVGEYKVATTTTTTTALNINRVFSKYEEAIFKLFFYAISLNLTFWTANVGEMFYCYIVQRFIRIEHKLLYTQIFM